ncbi:MAG: signal recognition particle protein, partial [Lentisphaeria bacterium]|nr:signal recognition particle protein [Lentisphaeria bacterium]
KKLYAKLKKNQFDYNDFLSQLKQISKLGGMEGILKFLPGGKQLTNAMSGVDTGALKRMEAMVLSMTPAERENPDIMDFSRRKRIARGCGMPTEAVSSFIKQFEMMRKMMRPGGMIGKMMAGGAMPEFVPGGGLQCAPAAMSKKEQEKRKKLAKLAKKERAKQRKRKR